MVRKFVAAILIGFGISILGNFLFFLHFFDSWQTKLSDNLFLPKPPHNDIVIIAIDDASIQKIGRWPWDRSVHADLLKKLGNLPKVIGIDVSFPESSTPADDAALANALKNASPSILPIESSIIRTQGDGVAIDAYLSPIVQLSQHTEEGLVNMVTDPDGITRLTPVQILLQDGSRADNFSVAILKRYLLTSGDLSRLSTIPLERGQMRIHFVGKPGTFPVYSYKDVLGGTIDPKIFEGKIVLVGATALDLHDTLITPVSNGTPMSGVEVHANVLQTMLEKKFLIPESPMETLLSISIVAILASLILSSVGILPGIILSLLLVGVYVYYAISSFDQGFIRNLIFPPLVVVLVFVAQTIYKYISENRQKRFIKKALSYYLSESVMKDVLSSPKKLSLGGQRKEMTVLFSDIAGFTSISEKLPPEQLAQILNQYLTRMTKIVFDHTGVLDKYIGDAVMAFWGAPLPQKNHALLACQTALAMQEDIAKIKEDWKKIGIPDFDVRIGVNTGDMVVGNMGSDLRFDYTLLGDNVNLGSRLEGINKEYGTHIIISGSTYEQVKDEVVVRLIDTVAVKGKAKGVAIYELRGLGQLDEKEKTFLYDFETARKLYEEGKFKLALKQFKSVSSKYSNDKTTTIYIARCEELIKQPPASWDGVFHAKSK